nr:MAG TPA: hypothetical protein [Caudoviricetes sp.]
MSTTENNYQETDLGNVSLNPRGEYDPGASYEYLDTVSYQGGSYTCLAELGTTITGIAPDPGRNTDAWQMLTLPGDLKPEYVAMHDDTVNRARQAESSRLAAELAQQAAEDAQADIQQLHTDTRQAATEAGQSRDSAAGYAQSADASRKAAAESEQNINAQVTGFDTKVSESVTQAQEEIATTRQQAIQAVASQQVTSIQAVKDQTASYIIEKETSAKTEIGNCTSEKIAEINKKVSEANTTLANTIADGTSLKTQLETTISTADTSKKDLDASNTAAGKTKTALDTSNTTATKTKTDLDATNKTATSLDTSLGTKITEGTQLQEDLQETGETAVINIQAEANKQIQNITAAGGGIENALSNFFALRRTGKVYTTRIYKYDTSTSPTGVKLNDNEGLVRKPSTNTVIGQDDYREIGLFMHFPCNFTVDDNGFIHITALQGQPDFKKTGKVDVGEVTMSAWVGITDNPEYVDYHYSDSPNEALGLVPMGESVNPDGTLSSFMVHGKYGAGDIDGVPYSSTGLILANGSQKGGKPVSHTGMIAYMKKKGSRYVGTTNWDLFYKQLMLIILYATINSRSVMTGCNSYTSQEMAAVAETGVTRVILPKAKANNYIVGSYVSVGDIGSNTNKDRYYSYMHNLAYDVKVLKIEAIDDTNSAVYVDAEPFNTTLTTCISTMPWRTGSTDSVLGSDGSPFSNTDNRNPFKIQGIETGYGAYEVLGNVFMDIVMDGDGTPKRDVYICMDASLLTTDMNAAKTRYKKVAAQVAYTAASWKYISKCFVDPALGIMVPTETKAGSTTGFCNGLYTDSGTSGQREWLSVGDLSDGSFYGLWFLSANYGVGNASWLIVSGVSPNGTRGEWQAAA